MKPELLTMTAFGSYDKEVTIDFSSLAKSGIFLICGATGGGKTTILDAMSTALYGKATGMLRNKQSKAFRCRSSDRSTDTVVDFVFSLGDERYRFMRRWRMGKTQGEDALKDAENACYIEADGEWQLIQSGAGRTIDGEAERILGLSHEQFVKVICLPQGEFRELLTTDSSKRTEIFEKLFGTARWKKIAKTSATQTNEINNRLQSVRERKNGLLISAGQETPAQLLLAAEQASAERDNLTAQLKDATERFTEADSNLTAAVIIDERFASLDRASEQLERLRLRKDEMAVLSDKLSRHLMLSELLPKYSLLDDARRQESKAVTALAQCIDKQKAAAAVLGDATTRYNRIDVLKSQREQLREQLIHLRTVKDKSDELGTVSGVIAHSEGELRQLDLQLDSVSQQIETLQQRIVKGRSLITDCEQQLALLPQAAKAVTDLQSGCERLRALDELKQKSIEAQTELESAERAVSEAAGRLNDNKQLLSVLEQLLTADKAYGISLTLCDGSPCPVCGSTEHPMPACRPKDAPDPVLLQKVRTDCENSQKEHERLLALFSTKKAAHDLVLQQLSEQTALCEDIGMGLREAEEQYKEAVNSLNRLEQLTPTKQKYTAALEQLQGQLDGQRSTSERLTALRAEQLVSLSTANGRRSALLSELDGLTIQPEQLDGKIAADEEELLALDTEIQSAENDYNDARLASGAAEASLQAARQNLSGVRERLNQITAEYTADCTVRGVDVECVIPDLLLEPSAAAQLKQQLEDYNGQCTAAEQAYSRLVGELDGKTRPKTGELRAIRDALSQKTSELSIQNGKAIQLAEQLSSSADELRRVESEINELAEQYGVMKRISAFLIGNNEKRTPIDQFVAGLLLDEIIRAANGYWGRLSRGQYTLKRREDVSGRNRYQGVDFEVVDAHIGQSREICTLSGGELFLASLSLAFGLSDVVQGFSGGLRLDSIFIDEGFGSLDGDSLELALDAISEIREGRIIGIISHVEGLRTRIPSKILVTKGDRGSSLCTVV